MAVNPNQPLDVIPLADSFLRAMQATEELDTAVKSANSSIRTFRIGLERAEPLRAIADTVTDVLKKQAVRDAAATFRAAGKGKLDEFTKNQIRETFDVAAEAMRDGTDNAFGRALKTLEIREEYARRIQDETQKRIILDNIKRSRKLLQEQSKNSVGFFGEIMEDIRQGPIQDFLSRLEGNFFGRILTRFAKDRLAEIRTAYDERVKAQQSEAQSAKERYEAEVEASNAATQIRITQDAELANQINARLQTEMELAKVQGDTVRIANLEAQQQLIETQRQSVAAKNDAVVSAKEEVVAAKIRGDRQAEAVAVAKVVQLEQERIAASDEYSKALSNAAQEARMSTQEVEEAYRKARQDALQTLIETEEGGNKRVQALYQNIADALIRNPALTLERLQTNAGTGINAGLAEQLGQGNLVLDAQGNITRGGAVAVPPTEEVSFTQPVATPVVTDVATTTLASPETVGVLSNLLSQSLIMTRHLELSSDNLAEIALNTASLQQPGVIGSATVVPSVTPTVSAGTPAALNAVASEATAAAAPTGSAVASAGGVAVTVNMSGSSLSRMFVEVKERALQFGNKIKENVTTFTTEATKRATEFAKEVGNRVVGPRAEAAETEQRVTEDARRQTERPDAKVGFLQKVFGGSLFENMKKALSAFKGGMINALKGLSEGIKAMFGALAEGLKKLANPQVLMGAAALGIIAIGLLAFAGAMYLFGQTNWGGALLGIGVFVAFAVAMALVAPLVAPILPLMLGLAVVLGVLSLSLLIFASAMYILGAAMAMFASVGLTGVGVVLALLAGLALLSPLLAVAGIGLLLAAPGFFVFGAALLALGLGMMMFADIGLGALPVVLGLLAGLAMIAPWLAIGGIMLLLAAPGYFLFGAALVALGLGMQMFAGVGIGELGSILGLLGTLALLSPLLAIASLLLLVASVGFLTFGLALISLGLGMQIFLGTAGAILPAIALLFALGMLAPLLYAASISLMLATPGFLLFGFALMALGAGLSAFVGSAGAILPAMALLMTLGLFGPALFLSSLFLAAASPGLILFSLALFTLGSALGAFAANAAGILPAIATLAALAMLAPFLFVAGIALGFAAPGFILFGVAMVLLGTGLLLFSIAMSQMTTGLLGLLGMVAMLPLLALGIAAMVLLLMPLVLPMILVGGALMLFAVAILTFFKALQGGVGSTLPAPEAAETTVTYNVAQMEIDNWPFSFPDFQINQQGAGGGNPGPSVLNLLSEIAQPVIVNAGGGGGGGGGGADNKLRNDENTFRRVQERFYNAALI